ELGIIADVIVRLVEPVAQNNEHRVILSKLDDVPEPRRQQKRPIAAVQRKDIFLSTVLTYHLDGAIDADHELRPAPVRVAAPLRTSRRCQGEHALDPERYLRRSFSHHYLAIRSRVPRQVNETRVG